MTADTVLGVVVAVYNNEDFVGEALDSLLAQSHQKWRCVVVDDGSTDGTAAVVRRYASADPRVVLVQQANAGSAAARNLGLQNLDPAVSLVAFLDGDDRWVTDALETLLQALDGRPDAVGSYGLAEYLDAGGTPVALGVHPARQVDRRRLHRHGLVDVDRRADTTFSVLVVSGPIWPAAVALHRRDVLDTVGGFDPRFRLQQDWDLYLRASRRGPYVFVDTQVAWYRQHGLNVTHRVGDRVFYQDGVRHKTWASPDNSPDQRREAVRVWRALQVRRVRWQVLDGLHELRNGRVRSAAQSTRAVALLVRQLVLPGPPPADRKTIDLTRRTL